MKVLLHPTYFPTIASFSLLVKEQCLLEVSDNYQKQTFRNRTYIYGANGKQILTVPILHTGGDTGRQFYKEVRVDNSVLWQKIHWKTLQTAYRTSPYFEYYEDKIAPIFEQAYTFLLDLNLKTIEVLLDCLHCSVKWEKTTQYQENYDQVSDFRYLSNAKKTYSIEQEPYYQIFSDKYGFVAQLSVLDLLFHEGNHTLSYLKEKIIIK